MKIERTALFKIGEKYFEDEEAAQSYKIFLDVTKTQNQSIDWILATLARALVCAGYTLVKNHPMEQ